jgi:ribosomal protein S18 acetylase RimI-like enzyme
MLIKKHFYDGVIASICYTKHMENITLRHATLNDFSSIQQLNHALFEDEFRRDALLNLGWSYEETGERFLRRMITDENCYCIIAEHQQTIIAYLIGVLLPIDSVRPVKRSELVNIFIKEKFRSHGVGTQMVEKFLKWSKQQGATHTVVGAQAENMKAIEFYKHLGFTPYHLRMEQKLE